LLQSVNDRNKRKDSERKDLERKGGEDEVIPGLKPGFPLGLKNLSLKASDFSTKEDFNLLKAQQRMSPMFQLRAV
jgi:hypothetical protein